MGIVNRLAQALGIAAMVFVAAMMLLITTDVIMRAVLNEVIIGSVELIEVLMVLLVLALAWCALKGRHVKVDLVMSHLSPRAQGIANSFNWTLGVAFCFFIAYLNVLEALSFKELGMETDMLAIPKYPFYFALSLGYALLATVMVPQLIENVRRALGK